MKPIQGENTSTYPQISDSGKSSSKSSGICYISSLLFLREFTLCSILSLVGDMHLCYKSKKAEERAYSFHRKEPMFAVGKPAL